MAALERLFNQTQRKLNKNKIGQQVKSGDVFSNLDDKFKFEKAVDFAQGNVRVQQFIKKSLGTYENQEYFEYKLTQQIKKGTDAVKQYNLNQIAQYLPWVFSSRFFFQPYRTLIYCVKNKIYPDDYTTVSKTIPEEVLNDQCYEAYYQAIKNNAPYVQTALKLLSKQAQPGFIMAAAKFIYDKLKTVFSNDIQKIKFTLSQLVHGLKAYGKIIVNFQYLKRIGSTTRINDRTFYYVWNNPQILIGLNQSYMQIYRVNGNQLTLVNQNQFDINYLRNIVLQNVTRIGGKLVKIYNQQANGTNQQTQNQYKQQQSFRKNYLDFKTKPKVVSTEQVQKKN